MKTDAFFYEAFTFDPQLILDLARIDVDCPYTFDSISTKAIEKRFDGCFRPIDGKAGAPVVFAEVQGYNDPKIYWRLFREISTYYELRSSDEPFVAVILYLEDKFSAPAPMLTVVPPCQLIAVNLEACLRDASNKRGVITVLKPLVAQSRARLDENVAEWRNEIEALGLPEHRRAKLMELLAYAIIQRFPGLSKQEVESMIHMTPLEETRAVKELVLLGEGRGEARGEARGETRGEFIGTIQTLQQVLGLPREPREELMKRSMEELNMLAAELSTSLEADR